MIQNLSPFVLGEHSRQTLGSVLKTSLFLLYKDRNAISTVNFALPRIDGE